MFEIWFARCWVLVPPSEMAPKKSKAMASDPPQAESAADESKNKRIRLGSQYISAVECEKEREGIMLSDIELQKDYILGDNAAREDGEYWPSDASVALALQPRPVFVVMLNTVCDKLTTIAGEPIELMPPLKNDATDKGWVAAWDGNEAKRSFHDDEIKKAQGAINGLSFDLLAGEDPDYGSVMEQTIFFFSQPKDVKQIICGTITKDKISSIVDEEYPPARSIRLFHGGLVHMRALIVAIFESCLKGDPEELLQWIRVLRSIVAQIGVHESDEEILDTFQESEDIHKRAKTEILNALAKARHEGELEESLSKKYRKKCTLPMAVEALATGVTWASIEAAKTATVNTLGALRRIDVAFNKDPQVAEAMRENIFLCGNKYLAHYVWKLNAVREMVPQGQLPFSDALTQIIQFLTYAVKRGDVDSVAEVTVPALRNKQVKKDQTVVNTLGVIGCIGWRVELIGFVKTYLEQTSVLLEIYATPARFDKAHPSAKEVQALAKKSRTLVVDRSYESKLHKRVELKANEVLLSLCDAKVDQDICTGYTETGSWSPSLEQMLETPALKYIKDELEIAARQDRELRGGEAHTGNVVELPGNGPGGVQQAASGSATTGSGGGQQAGAGVAGEPVVDDQASVMQTAMMLRSGLSSEKIVPGNAKAAEISAAATDLEKVDKYAINKKVQLRAFCVSSFGETEKHPWEGDATPLTPHQVSRITALAQDMSKGDVAAVSTGDKEENADKCNELLVGKKLKPARCYFFFNGELPRPSSSPAGGVHVTPDKKRNLGDAESAKKEPQTLSNKTRKKTGLASGGDLQPLLIATCADKSPHLIRKKDRLNKKGDSNSKVIEGLIKLSPKSRCLPQLRAEDKRAILSTLQRTVDCSTVQRNDAEVAKLPKRMQKSLKKFAGSLPLNFNSLHYSAWCEVIHMTSAGHVVDYSMGDASLAIATLSMNKTYGGMCLSKMHQQFCLQRIDKTMCCFMKDATSPHWQGEKTKALIGMKYDVNIDATLEGGDEDASASSEDE